MQTIAALSLVMLTLAPSALGDNCVAGLDYCGYGLYKKGDYDFIVNQCLRDNYQTIGTATEDNTLFSCVDESDGYPGYIRYNTYCAHGCVTAADGHSDYCA